MKILLTGATGLIGKELGKELVRQGHSIVALSRNASKARLELPYPAEIIEGDLNQGPLTSVVLNSVQAVIHLAGENVGEGRWTQERKKKILESRTVATANLIASLPADLQVLISASATGYYGNRGEEILTEQSRQGEGFLAEVCEKWEGAVDLVSQRCPRVRIVKLRTGVVFAPFGGALMKMLTPFQMGVGGVLGSGQQWMSWIHLTDLVRLYSEALANSAWSGVYNAVAPHPVSNREFTQVLCQALKVQQGPPAPSLAISVLFGEMGQVILDSQNVKSERLREIPFQYPDLRSALNQCAGPYAGGNQVFFAQQYFDLPREKVFHFFSKAENLEAITPPLLNFHVQAMSTEKIQEGTLIDYKLKIRGVPVSWRTRIEEWSPAQRFVDTQLKGPYKVWHHTHAFEDLGSGTLMTDVVKYVLPLGLLGRLAGGAFVKGDVEKIFAYRRQTVPKLLS